MESVNVKNHVFEKAGHLEDLLKKHLVSGCSKFHIIGHEKNDILILRWHVEDKTKLGCYTFSDEQFEELLSLKGNINVIQATVSQNLGLLCFVTRSQDDVYTAMISQSWSYLKSKSPNKQDSGSSSQNSISSMFGKKKIDILQQSKLQTMTQFLYRKTKVVDYDEDDDTMTELVFKLLVFVHHKSITMHSCKLVQDVSTGEYQLQVPIPIEETVALKPTWAQWDMKFQCLYFIYNKVVSSSDPANNGSGTEEMHPMLSALQFHDDLPHETVLNIPVNVPVSIEPFGGYLDDPVPLRIHDGSMDMIVLTDARGIVCICHHYLYQVVQPPKSGCDTVHFAYSVIMLHHATIVHSSVTGVQHDKAVEMRPTFCLYEDYVLIHAPGLFLHLLDTHLTHDPYAHIYLPSPPFSSPVQYFSLVHSPTTLIDIISLSIFNKTIDESKLIEVALEEKCDLQLKLAIIHYFLIHKNNQNSVAKILEPLGEQIMDPMTGTILQEVMIAATYIQTVSCLNTDTICFASQLPFSMHKYGNRHEIKLGKNNILSISQDDLVNPISVMLLTPQQRLTPYRKDIWNLLYEAQNSGKTSRFIPQTVVNKLLVSLHCYQPEVLSRCSTPLSPSTTMGSTSDLLRSLRFKEPLPFVEKEQVTATKQEHITSVNLRELSIHLLKWAGIHGRNTKSPIFVHSVATLWVTTQVEVSRWLCYVITSAARLKCSYTRGFGYIDSLTQWEVRILFLLYDRFNSSCGCIGFPVPPGFASFFAYLSYRTLSRTMFLQYVERNVFELNIDVIKAIFADTPDDTQGVQQKLQLLSLLPRSRIKRILNNWNHPFSLMLRAREHSMNILSGAANSQPRYARKLVYNSKNTSVGFHTEMLPCFDSFLKLLLAKVNLNELDVQLLLEATMSSLQLN